MEAASLLVNLNVDSTASSVDSIRVRLQKISSYQIYQMRVSIKLSLYSWYCVVEYESVYLYLYKVAYLYKYMGGGGNRSLWRFRNKTFLNCKYILILHYFYLRPANFRQSMYHSMMYKIGLSNFMMIHFKKNSSNKIIMSFF